MYVCVLLLYIYIYMGSSIYMYSKHYKKRREKVHQTTNTKISSMHT